MTSLAKAVSPRPGTSNFVMSVIVAISLSFELTRVLDGRSRFQCAEGERNNRQSCCEELAENRYLLAELLSLLDVHGSRLSRAQRACLPSSPAYLASVGPKGRNPLLARRCISLELLSEIQNSPEGGWRSSERESVSQPTELRRHFDRKWIRGGVRRPKVTMG